MSQRRAVCRANGGVANTRKRKRHKQRWVNAARRLQGNDQKWRQQRQQRPKWRWRTGETVSVVSVSLVSVDSAAVLVMAVWRSWVQRRRTIGTKAVVTTWPGEFRMRDSTPILGWGWAALLLQHAMYVRVCRECC